jgi:hypothetical protein
MTGFAGELASAGPKGRVGHHQKRLGSRPALQAEGLPVDTLGDLDPQQVAVAKTADRRILGTINDLAFTTEHVIATAGGLARCDIDALHHDLHRTINSITGYIPPIGLVTISRQDQR